MNNKNILAISAATLMLAAAAGLVSCDDKSSANDKSVDFYLLSGQYNFELENSKELSYNDSNLTFCDSVAIMMPSVIFNNDITALVDSINRIAFDTVGVFDNGTMLASHAERVARASGYEVKPIETAFKTLAEPSSYELIRGYVVSLDDRWLSYCVSNDIYMAGAAHGMPVKSYINYVMPDNRIVTLKDIFSPRGLEALPSLISKEAGAMAATLGPTSISALPSGGDFFVSPAGEIVFVYQPYEVASYAQGFIHVSFYPYELSDYMTSDGLRLFNLQDLE